MAFKFHLKALRLLTVEAFLSIFLHKSVGSVSRMSDDFVSSFNAILCLEDGAATFANLNGSPGAKLFEVLPSL